MKDFNTIRDTVIQKAVGVVDKTKEFAKVATDKTKTLARITRLTAENATDRDLIKQNMTELGRQYYERYKDGETVEFAQLVEEIKAAEERITARKAEVEALKAENNDDDIEVEFVEESEGMESEIISYAEAEIEAEEQTTTDTAAQAEEDASEDEAVK